MKEKVTRITVEADCDPKTTMIRVVLGEGINEVVHYLKDGESSDYHLFKECPYIKVEEVPII